MNHKQEMNPNNPNQQYFPQNQIQDNKNNLIQVCSFLTWILQKRQKWQKKLNGSQERKNSQKSFLTNLDLIDTPTLLYLLYNEYTTNKEEYSENTTNTKQTNNTKEQQNKLTEEQQNKLTEEQQNNTIRLHEDSNHIINLPIHEVPKKTAIMDQQQNNNLIKYTKNLLNTLLNFDHYTFDSRTTKWNKSCHSTTYTKQLQYQKNIYFYEIDIFGKLNTFGMIHQDLKKSNYTHVYLFRHHLPLTSEQITEIQKYAKCNNYKYDNIQDFKHTQKTKLFRCPLPSCHHQPLNNISIQQNLFQHCKQYHQNDLKPYIFYYKKNHIWQTFSFSPLPPQTNTENYNADIHQNENEKNNNLQTISIENNPLRKKLNKKHSRKTDSSSEIDKSETISKLLPSSIEYPFCNNQKHHTIFQ